MNKEKPFNPQPAIRNPQSNTAFPLILFFAFFTLYVLTMPGVPLRGDPEAMFLVARGLAADGSAALDRNPVVALVPGRGGRYYAKFGPAQSLIEAPFIAAGRAVSGKNAAPDYRYYLDYFAASWAAPLVSALSVVLLYAIILCLGFHFSLAAGMAVVFGLCTMAWPYAGSGFSEPLQGMLLLLGMYGGLRGGNARRAGGAVAWAAVAGAAAGALVLTKSALAILAPLIGVYLLWTFSAREKQRKAGTRKAGTVTTGKRGDSPRFSLVMIGFMVFCLAAIPGVAATLYYNFYRFGSALNFGYNTSHDAWFGFSTPLLTGLYGLLLSPGKSVFLYNPVLILGLLGARAFHRERPRESFFVWGACIFLLILYARWWAWHGDWSWGPRFLLPCVAPALLPAATLFRNAAHKPWLKTAIFTLAAASLCVQILGTFVNHNEYIYFVTRRIPQHPLYVSSPAQERYLRDAGLTAHFVPEFSPVAGHAWLLSGAVRKKMNPGMDMDAELARTAPWRNLIRIPAAPGPPPDPGFAFWHVYLPRADFFPPSRAWVLPLRNSMAAACVLLWLMLFLIYRATIIRLRAEHGGHAD